MQAHSLKVFKSKRGAEMIVSAVCLARHYNHCPMLDMKHTSLLLQVVGYRRKR